MSHQIVWHCLRKFSKFCMINLSPNCCASQSICLVFAAYLSTKHFNRNFQVLKWCVAHNVKSHLNMLWLLKHNFSKLTNCIHRNKIELKSNDRNIVIIWACAAMRCDTNLNFFVCERRPNNFFGFPEKIIHTEVGTYSESVSLESRVRVSSGQLTRSQLILTLEWGSYQVTPRLKILTRN